MLKSTWTVPPISRHIKDSSPGRSAPAGAYQLSFKSAFLAAAAAAWKGKDTERAERSDLYAPGVVRGEQTELCSMFNRKRLGAGGGHRVNTKEGRNQANGTKLCWTVPAGVLGGKEKGNGSHSC